MSNHLRERIEQIASLRDEEVRLREAGRTAELLPDNQAKAVALFRRASAARAKRLQVLRQCDLL